MTAPARRTTGHARYVCLLAILAFSLLAIPDARAAQRPNFVIVQTDDMAFRLLNGTYLDGNRRKVPIMPNLRALFGKQGTDFRSAYSPSPMCSPSRAALLTGSLPHNNEVVANDGAWGGWRGWLRSTATEPNLATVLDDAGYHTAHFGKWINGYGEDPVEAPAVVPAGWDVWASDASDQSTRDYYGYTQLVRNEREGIVDEIRGPYGSETYAGDLEIDPPWCDIYSRSDLCNYHADRMNALAVDEIRSTDEPFFVMVDHHGPHSDNSAPPGPQPATRHLGVARNATLPTLPSFNEKNTGDKDFLVRRLNGSLDRGRTRTIEAIWRRSIESLQAIDEGIGQIQRALRETERLSSTYFIFASDNGYFHGEHRFSWGKGLPYEEATKVPLIISGPGIRAGTERDPVSLLDVAPTVLDLAGLGPGGMQFDGTSLRESLEGVPAADRAIVIERITSNELIGDPDYPPRIPVVSLDPSRPAGKAPNLAFRGLRIGPYKYFRYDSGGEELYDLSRDPFELYNQTRSPGYADLLEFMRASAARYRDCAGEECLVQPGTTPRVGKLLTDARPPPRAIGLKRAFYFRHKIYAGFLCPVRSEQACRITVGAESNEGQVTEEVQRRIAIGGRARVVLPVLPEREIDVLRLSERGRKSLRIRTRVEGQRKPIERTVEFLQR